MRLFISQLAVAVLCPLFSFGLVCCYAAPLAMIALTPVGFIVAGLLSPSGGH